MVYAISPSAQSAAGGSYESLGRMRESLLLMREATHIDTATVNAIQEHLLDAVAEWEDCKRLLGIG